MPKVAVEEHNQYQRRYYGRTFKRTMVPRRTPYVLRHLERMRAMGGLARGQEILEIGCGMGRYTLPLVEDGYRVTGLDLSPENLERLRGFHSGKETLDLVCGDLVAFAEEAGGRRFDAVIGFFVLHHIHDLGLAFAAVARLLRPGGQALFLEPNPLNPLYYIQIAATPGMTWKGERGLVGMRPGPVGRAFLGAGLERPRSRSFGLWPPVLANTRPGAWTEERLERLPGLAPFLAFRLFAAQAPR